MKKVSLFLCGGEKTQVSSSSPPGTPAPLRMSVDQEDWDRQSPRYYIALMFDDSALWERQDTVSESTGQCFHLAVEYRGFGDSTAG